MSAVPLSAGLKNLKYALADVLAKAIQRKPVPDAGAEAQPRNNAGAAPRQVESHRKGSQPAELLSKPRQADSTSITADEIIAAVRASYYVCAAARRALECGRGQQVQGTALCLRIRC